MTRKEEGRGLTIIEDSLDASSRVLKDYFKKSKERLITVTRNGTDNIMINRTIITRKQKWEEKQLYGYLKQETGKISHKMCMLLRKGNFKRETESLLIATQNNVIKTNYDKANIDKMQQNSMYVMY